MIIPSIDLMDGKAVQLVQGKKKVLERSNVVALAEEFSLYGEIAVIDLDAALGRGNNLALVKKLCSVAACRVGGGIRSVERAQELLRAGASKIIIGTKASVSFLKQLPKDKVIVAVDARDGKVVDEGWRNATGVSVVDRMEELEPYCSGFLFTNVDKEGLMGGVDFSLVEQVRNSTSLPVTIAGGITTREDVQKIESAGCNSQIGMALYTGKISLSSTFVSLLKFKGGLIPTVVQDETGRVLMFAFSSRDSLLKTFSTRRGTYFSRSRGKLWTKGETSGNIQEIVTVRYDCDRDSLLFTVKQKNVACHTDSYSCFGDREFFLEDLYSVVLDRVRNPKKKSYTSRLAEDEKKIMAKIKEEAEEVVNYTSRDNLVWELADLQYFLMILMAKKGIAYSDVLNELKVRKR
tara:strand:- start:4762 stop:5979 length:1218 start_codon:yes stop_codon:yes gene_type:complete